jgi:hypothetical protein
LINKQLDTVLRLLTELKKITFLILTNNNRVLLLHINRLNEEYLNEYKNKKILFDIKYSKELSTFWNIVDDLFLPREIKKVITPLIIDFIESKDIEEQNNSIFLTIKSDSNWIHTLRGDLSYIKNKNEFGKINDDDMTLGEFINQWSLIINSVHKWLEKYSNNTIKNINF